MSRLIRLPLDAGPRAPVVLGSALHTGYDRLFQERGTEPDRDYLIFMDSRGMSKGWDVSLVRPLVDRLPPDASYRLVVRPLEVTVIPTLVNFLLENEGRYGTLITNVGFVDLTPKKAEFLDDIESQSRHVDPTGDFLRDDLGPYRLSDGSTVTLGSVRYPDTFLDATRAAIHASADRCIWIATPLVDPDIPIQRRRPSSFFQGLERTNELLRALARDVEYLDVPRFNETDTYDAVHYTGKGNQRILSRLQSVL